MLLRYPYRCAMRRNFDDIQDVKVTKDMLDLASTSSSRSPPAISSWKNSKTTMSRACRVARQEAEGTADRAAKKTAPGNVVNLMDPSRAASSHRRRPRLGPQCAD